MDPRGFLGARVAFAEKRQRHGAYQPPWTGRVLNRGEDELGHTQVDLCNDCFNDRTTVRAGFSRAGSSSSTTALDYGEIGRLTKATYPAIGGLASAKEWRWNDEARTVTRIDEEGRSLIERYDQLGRLKRATYSDGTYATFYYDKDGRMTEARLFAAGGEPVCKTGADYNARGRKTGESWDVWGTRYSIGYEYNEAGDVVRMTFPDGASVEYLYDGWGRLIAIPGLFGTGAFDPGFFYAQSGALSRIGRANGVPTVIAEDVRGRVDRIAHGQGGQPILDLDYEYDSVGNVVRINGRAYTYDRLGRLVGYQRPTQSGTVE